MGHMGAGADLGPFAACPLAGAGRKLGGGRSAALKEVNRMRIGPRIAVPLGFAVALAIAALAIAPRAYEAQWLLAARDDPALLADHAVTRSFTAATAEREIN